MSPRVHERASDRRLLQAVRAGDPRAFDILYRRYHPPLLSFCRHVTGRLEDAEDAVQHTFLAAHREIGRSAAKLNLRPWLFRVAHNRCISLLRSRRMREGNAALRTARDLDAIERELGDSRTTEGLSEEVERRDELRALVADLGRLPDVQRASLVLAELEALSHAEIAVVLDVAPAKVRSLVFQARSSLMSTRAAREIPCQEIRLQLSTLRGPALRRRTLRRHVRMCEGCREFDTAVRVQRGNLAVVLPVIATEGVGGRVAPWALAGGVSAGKGGGAAGLAASGVTLGGAAGGGGGLGGLIAAVAGSAVPAVVVAAVAVTAGGTLGIVKADVVNPIDVAGGEQAALSEVGAPHPIGAARLEGEGAPHQLGRGPTESDRPGGNQGGRPEGRGPRPGPSEASGSGDLPPGLAKKAEQGDLPPGFAKKKEHGMPPGLAKRQSGGAGTAHPGAGADGKGESRRGAPPGRGNAEGRGNASGQGNAGGQGNANGHAIPPGQAKPREDRSGGAGNPSAGNGHPKEKPTPPNGTGANPQGSTKSPRPGGQK